MADQSTAASTSHLKTFSDVANAAAQEPALMGRPKSRRMSYGGGGDPGASLGLASKSFGAESEAQDMPAFMARELQQLNSKLESVVAALGSLGQRQGRIESELLAMNRPPKPGNRDLEA